jgi:autoinducer 2-degrading protein
LSKKIKEGFMLVVHVHVHVKEDKIEEFKKISLENAENSIKETGVARFDVIQQNDDESKFILNEVYKTPDAPAKHKETDQYKKWRDAVADMMAEPRYSVKFTNLFPEDSDW